MTKKKTAIILHPAKPEAKKLTKDDVWGVYDRNAHEMKSNGMIVARTGDKDPYFKDTVPFKSVTVICEKDQVDEVEYWLEYVHGGGSIENRKILPNGKIALRSNYMAW